MVGERRKSAVFDFSALPRAIQMVVAVHELRSPYQPLGNPQRECAVLVEPSQKRPRGREGLDQAGDAFALALARQPAGLSHHKHRVKLAHERLPQQAQEAGLGAGAVRPALQEYDGRRQGRLATTHTSSPPQ
jgi:hypothetical protein